MLLNLTTVIPMLTVLTWWKGSSVSAALALLEMGSDAQVRRLFHDTILYHTLQELVMFVYTHISMYYKSLFAHRIPYIVTRSYTCIEVQ